MRLLCDRSAVLRTLVGAIATAALWIPSVALAGDLEDLQAARTAFQQRHYAEAVQLLEAMVGGPTPRVRSRPVLLEARKYLGAAYLYLTRREDAERQFEALLHDDPDARLDSQTFAFEVLQVFGAVQERLRHARETQTTIEEQQAAALRAHRRDLIVNLIDLAQSPEVEVRHDPLLAWLPFGVGQFQNRNEGLGWFFLVSEAGLLALGGAAGITALLLPHGSSLIDIMNYATWITAASTLGLIVTGIIEAHVNFVPSHRERRQRELPPELMDPDLLLGVGSIGLRFHF